MTDASESFDLRIDSIAAGGDGVGRHDGMVVFVPRTAPGDVARVRARRDGRLMRGSVIELLHHSTDRVEPPCRHYEKDRCGGCQVQHLAYEAQIRAKAGIVRDSLTRIGGVAVEPPVVEPSGAEWRYRTKLTLALRRHGDRWIAGLHRLHAPDEVFELIDCPITDARVMAAWSAVLGQCALLPGAARLRGAVRLLESGFAFTLEGSDTWPSHPAFFAALPALTELWWAPEGKRRRLMQTRAGERQAGASFTQVNPGVAAQLQGWVLRLASELGPASAVDAYAGTGDIAVGLEKQGVRVAAIEFDRDAARVCATRLSPASRAIAAPVEIALPDALPADLVVLNPPRAGLDERVPEVLVSQDRKPAVVYVSCNPATLARDVRRLYGYRIKSLRAFDMFPQTAHVETVCELVPAA